MSTIAYRNGQFVPANDISVPVYDTGFVLGVTITEQLRSLGGQLFQLDEHLARFANSLEVVGVKLEERFDALRTAALHVASHNYEVNGRVDMGLCLFATPGAYPTMRALASEDEIGWQFVMHSYPLPFAAFAPVYANGQRLVTTNVRQVPQDCWPVEMKCRSRMHYYLADLAAREIDPSARAILQNERDEVLETTTANILVVDDQDTLVSPPRESILPGISVEFVRKLALEVGLQFTHRTLQVSDLQNAREVILCSTPVCILPVSHVNDRALPAAPGPIFQRLYEAWKTHVDCDFIKQASDTAN